MSDTRIKRVVIVGGGTAGWITAAFLAKAMGPLLEIQLIQSAEIGVVGVGEATIPAIRLISKFLELDEDEVLKASQGTFKLGIQFNDWRRIGDSYIHAFGDIGLPLGLLGFYHYWLRSRDRKSAKDLWAFSLNAVTAMANRFARLEKVGSSPLSGINYAYHFDATRFGKFLYQHSAARTVQLTEGKIVDVQLRAEDGFIESVQLESGEIIAGDLFIDCSGLRALLIEGALQTGYENWQHWLPCDRALFVHSTRVEPMRPYTQANARPAGWQWRIPLQDRDSNGHVYCSRFMSDDEATSLLLADLDGEALAEPSPVHFTTGMRRQAWNRNCVALGLSSGFFEPLESTNIHLAQSGANRLLALFPDRHFDPALIAEYNRQTRSEYEHIRDFIILHYKATERDDTPFWQYCAQIDIPESLARKINLFRNSGMIFREDNELFTEGSWLQVLIGQGIEPTHHHLLADAITPAQLDEFLAHIHTLIHQTVPTLPSHAQFIAEHCKAEAPS